MPFIPREEALNRLRSNVDNGKPNMFLASLFAPALIEMGKAINFGEGVHATQSFNSHFPYDNGPLTIQFGNLKERKSKAGKLHTVEGRGIQGDRVIFSGWSSIGSLEDSLAA